MSQSAKWYVIHTYSGYEAMVKDTLEKMVENSNLQDQILEIQIPMEQTIEEKNGKKKVVERNRRHTYIGTVVSDKMDKTINIQIVENKRHEYCKICLTEKI